MYKCLSQMTRQQGCSEQECEVGLKDFAWFRLHLNVIPNLAIF